MIYTCSALSHPKTRPRDQTKSRLLRARKPIGDSSSLRPLQLFSASLAPLPFNSVGSLFSVPSVDSVVKAPAPNEPTCHNGMAITGHSEMIYINTPADLSVPVSPRPRVPPSPPLSISPSLCLSILCPPAPASCRWEMPELPKAPSGRACRPALRQYNGGLSLILEDSCPVIAPPTFGISP